MLLGLLERSRFSVGSLEGTARKTSMEYWTIMDIMECLEQMFWKMMFPLNYEDFWCPAASF